MSDGPAIPARDNARSAMPTEGFLDRVSEMSIDKLMERLEGTPRVAIQLKNERANISALASKLATGDMRPLLEWLLDMTLRRPMIMPGLGLEGQFYCALREGQNQVVWQILQAVADGRGEVPPSREGM